MDRNLIIELLSRKLAGEATQQEIQDLDDLILQNPDSIYYEEALSELWLPPATELNTDAAFKKHISKYKNELKYNDSAGRGKKGVAKLLAKYSTNSSFVISLLLLAVSGYFLVQKSPSSFTTPAYTQTVTGGGMRKQLNMPDGTLVWLNSKSSISFGDVKGTDSRLINFAGEGFFKVAPYNHHYFVINTAKLTIKGLTASFNVKAYADEKIEISVLAGALEVIMNDNDAQHFILNPSEKLVLVDKRAAPDKVSTMDSQINRTMLLESINPLVIGDNAYSTETSWVNNRLVFKDKTLPELKTTLERWFNVNLYIKNEAVKSKLFTGNFTGKNLEQVLKTLQSTNFFHYNITKQEVVIY